MRRRALSLAAMALALGCSGSGGGDRPAGVPPGFIVWTEPIPESLAAPVRGVVHVADDGCVVLTGETDTAGEPAIWPFGTTFDGTVIRTADGVEIRDGDFVDGAGGWVEYEIGYYAENTTLAVDLGLVRACGAIAGDRIPAFNPLDPIIVTE